MIPKRLHEIRGHAASLNIPLPNEAEMSEYVPMPAITGLPELTEKSDLPVEVLGRRVTDLCRVGAAAVLARILKHEMRITGRGSPA